MYNKFMEYYLSFSKYKAFLKTNLSLNNNKILFFKDDQEIISFVNDNFDPKNKYYILVDNGCFLFMYLTKIPKAIVTYTNDEYSAYMSALHNNANILIIPMATTSINIMNIIIENFHNTRFEGGRHIARLDMLDKELD